MEQFETAKAVPVRVLGAALLVAAIVVRLRPAPAAPEVKGAARGRATSVPSAPPRWHPLDLCIAAWLIVEALSTWTSVVPPISLFGDRAQMEGLLTSLGLAGIYAGARFATGDSDTARRTLLWMVGAVAAACLVGFWQLGSFREADWQNAPTYEGFHRPFGTLG